MFDDCLFGGGLQDDCARIADQEFDFCLAAECGVVDPPPPPPPDPPPPDCGGMCSNEARFEFEACINGDGLLDDCVSLEQQAFEACLDRECTETVPL